MKPAHNKGKWLGDNKSQKDEENRFLAVIKSELYLEAG
jgi:hypothetical protein